MSICFMCATIMIVMKGLYIQLQGNNKEIIQRKSHIPRVKNDDANTCSDINKINKRKLVDIYISSTPSNVKDPEKVSKKET
ncbi:hypothetical protein Hanom_Chr12g01180551 [Helianthus anomalus]